MFFFTPNKIIDILLILGECQHNYRRASLLYRRRFPQRQCPTASSIWRIERKAKHGHCRRHTRRRNYNEDNDGHFDARNVTLLAMMNIDPNLSLRDIECHARSTVHRIFRATKYNPYRISLHQALTEEDRVHRVAFCQWAIEQIEHDPEFFRYVLFSDETTFNSREHLNRHNCRYWLVKNPHWMRQIY